jgi:hypothetical protein
MVDNMSYNPNPQNVEGGTPEVTVGDEDVRGLLVKILKELKKMNFHLTILTDTNIKNTEIE